MSNRSKLCKILDVDYGEKFRLGNKFYRVLANMDYNEDKIYVESLSGEEWYVLSHASDITNLINNVDKIIHHKTFTPQEVSDAEVLHRIWDMKIICRDNRGFVNMIDGDGKAEELCIDAFPSVKNNESYTYEQIVNKENNND